MASSASKLITSRKGRKCKHPRCKHILSIYNHALYCHVHLVTGTQPQGAQVIKLR